MANHSLDLGNKAQQQIAWVSACLCGFSGFLLSGILEQNAWACGLVTGTLAFVFALIHRGLGLLICLGSGAVILWSFAGV